MSQQPSFKWRHFEAEIILLCVRWYLRYPLSYRDLEEMMAERRLSVDHTTIYRWVQRYAPELDWRCRPHLKVTTDSWRVDRVSRHYRKTQVECNPAERLFAHLMSLALAGDKRIST